MFFLIYGFISLSYVQVGLTLYILKTKRSNWEGGGEYGYNLLKTLSFRKKKLSLLPDQYNRRDGNVEKIANYFVSSITQLLHG